MRRTLPWITALFLAALLFPHLALADSFGVSAYPFQSYTGDVELLEGQQSGLASAGTPHELHLTSGSIQFAYLSYPQYADENVSSSFFAAASSLALDTDVLSLSYVVSLPTAGGIEVGGGIGGAIYRSRGTYTYAYIDSDEFYAYTLNMASTNALDLGFIASGFIQTGDPNGVGFRADARYISHQTTIEGSGTSELDVDVGGLLFGFGLVVQL